jgi:hypothetical protein
MNVYPMNEEMVLSHLTAEQRHLRCRLQKLEQLFTTQNNELPTPLHMNKLHRELAELRQQLRELYLQEEEGGLLEEAIAQRPAIGPHVTALNHEHPGLLAETEKLLVYCQGTPVSAEHWQALGEQYRGLKRKLCEHELQSTRLVQAGFNFDCHELLD